MRAGLLSDPRVVVALRTLFVPVHLSALNTAHCMRDPRDVELLRSYAGAETDRFAGGERETFLLPDGTMQRVFLSLGQGRASQYTAATRRDDGATSLFRHHGALALGELHDELPGEWRALWDGTHPELATVVAEAPRWPLPRPGEQGFRVFARNTFRMYDDLHGCEIVPVAPADLAAPLAQLQRAGDRAALPVRTFRALARAMVPRGQVDTELDDGSITGGIELVVETASERELCGRVEGTFALEPARLEEAGKRKGAAGLFTSRGRLAGRFTVDRATGALAALRAAATEVTFVTDPGKQRREDYFEPWHRVAFEWVDGPAPLPDVDGR